MSKISLDYFFELFEKKTIPHVFSEIHNTHSNEVLKNDAYSEEEAVQKAKIYSFFFIPDYLKPTLNKNTFGIKRVTQFFKGYTIVLNGFANADAYLKHRFRSNAKTIRRRVNRLETCFSISYEMHYGSISDEKYTNLMNILKEMLENRFEERNDVNQSLLSWEKYHRLFLPLIQQKKASMFIIYNNHKPIVISLNHHFHKVMFSAISSYDINYSKFSLGSVEIYKKLDWCLQNGYHTYEFGMGDLSYKREWSNHIYNFEHQILYPKKSISGFLIASLEYCKVSFKEFIFKLAYVRYKKYKNDRKKENPEKFVVETFPIEQQELEVTATHIKVDFNSKAYDFLKRYVYDYLYASKLHESKVTLYKNKEDDTCYSIAGNHNTQNIKITQRN